jgi:hypothetical protein
VDEIDAAFSDILSRVENLGRSSDFGSDFFGFNGRTEAATGNDILPRLRRILSKASQLMSDLRRTGLADEAIAIKQYIINLATAVPWFDNLFLPTRRFPFPGMSSSSPSGVGTFIDDRVKVERRVNDLDTLLNRFEKVTSDFRSLPTSEKDKVIEKNQKTLRVLNTQHSKLSKKCFYIRNRIEYLLNELSSSSTSRSSSKSVMERLLVWKRFIENNEYILNQRLTREERETLYAFLTTKLKEADPDLREAEGVLFD